MVAIMSNNELFEKSRLCFNEGDVQAAIEHLEALISSMNAGEIKENDDHVQYLNDLLKYCRDNQLVELEAKVLRVLGTAYRLLNKLKESENFHHESLKIQRKSGRKADLADGLVLLSDSLQINGKHDECLDALKTAADIYRELGKLRREKELRKHISKLEKFSKDMLDEDYYVRKFHIRRDI